MSLCSSGGRTDGTLYGATEYGGAGWAGQIFKVNPDGSGYVVLGGNFDTLSGQTRRGLGRLNVDGSFDAAFDADVDYSVNSMVRQPSGKIIPGGGFTAVNGARRDSLARISADGTLDPTFNPGTDSTVFSMALLGAHELIVGGGFSKIGGQARDNLARLNVYQVREIVGQPRSQTAEVGSGAYMQVQLNANPAPAYRWFFQGNPVGGATTRMLRWPAAAIQDTGIYRVVATNLFGSVTSAPAALSVITPVPRALVSGLVLSSPPGTEVNLDWNSTIGAATSWVSFDSVPITNIPQWHFDLSTPAAPQKFYRAWHTNAQGTPPDLALYMVPGLVLYGTLGANVRIEYIDQFGPVDQWHLLVTLTLTNNPQLFLDISALGQPPRLWRAVAVP